MSIIEELEFKSNSKRKKIVKKNLDNLRISHKPHLYEQGENIIVSSGNKSEIGILSHFDAVLGSPGANDNASAVAVCLDLLKRFKKNPLENIGIRGMFFDDEEFQLRGSRAYVREKGINKLIGVYNMELVGFGDKIVVWSDSALSKGLLLKTVLDVANKKNIETFQFPYVNRILNNSGDHLSFSEAGLKESFCLTTISEKDSELLKNYFQNLIKGKRVKPDLSESPLFKNYHQPSDTSKHLEEKTLKMISDLVYESICEIDKIYER